MNRIFASFLIFAIVGIFAKISPSSEDDIDIDDFANSAVLDALVNTQFGVITGVSDQGVTMIGSFEIGDDFELNSVAYLDNYCDQPQLINYGDSIDNFIMFCNTNGSASFETFGIVPSSGNMTITNSSEYTPSGTVMISASAFVTKQGNIYLSDSYEGEIAIVEFQVRNGYFLTRFDNILDDYEGDWTIQDLHSLPYDAGVSVIINSNDNDTQMFLACYFNGSIFEITIPEGQTLQYVGRHRGSNFGYTIGVEDDQSPYTIITAWDLSDLSTTNNVQIKGQLYKRNDGHFSTSEMVFVYTESDESGYIYELPYSEIGFLPATVNFEEISSLDAGNLASGEDGTHIYCFTSNDDGDAQLSRWTF